MPNLTIKKIDLQNSGKKISYSYELSKSIRGLFKESFWIEYDSSVEGVPESILIIPLLANILPISWLAGFDIVLESIDKHFYEAILKIKQVFINEFPDIKDKESKIVFNHLVDNSYNCKKSALLFSGGVDAYASYFNHQDEDIDLILIHGADIPINDKKQWETAKESVSEEDVLSSNQKHFIKMNCRDFYTYKVNELIAEGSWWGSIQHGLALTCAVAPLSYKCGYRMIYIASSYTSELPIFWGSMPEIDNNIKWANTSVVHDAYHMRRIDKIDLIVRNSILLDKEINLRVCYSELNKGMNCSDCEKCYRTILGLALFNVDPNNFGFFVNSSLYDKVESMIKKGLYDDGTRFFWRDILNTMKNNKIFQFDGIYYSQDILENKIEHALSVVTIRKKSKIQTTKKRLIYKYPSLFKKYLKFRKMFK